jgi:IclR family transcriptional regulator, acetate operon repressor
VTEDGRDVARPAGTSSVQSVDRAVSVLEILSVQGETGVSRIAAELGVHRSTAFRLMAVLEARGLVEQVAERGRYRLGFGIMRLAGAVTSGMDLVQQSQPVCERLAEEIGETVNVAVLDGNGCMNLTQVRGQARVTTHNWVGQRTPLHATSSGKVLLSHAPEDRIAAALQAPLERWTPHTVVDPEVLRAQLAEVRAHGYAVTVEEYETGLNAVAAPVRGMDGAVVAAVSVSGPSYRLLPDRMPDIAETICAGAAQISGRLGYVDSR